MIVVGSWLLENEALRKGYIASCCLLFLFFDMHFLCSWKQRKTMESSVSNQKTIERVVSHRALQMGSSFSCQICVVGFLCGVCIASLFVAALTLFGLGGVSMSSISMGISQWNTSSDIISKYTDLVICVSLIAQVYLVRIQERFRGIFE